MQSREPLKKIILGFLSLYLNFRSKTRNTQTNKIKYTAEYLFGKVFTGNAPVDDRLDKIVNELIDEVQSFKVFDDFYLLIFKLREKAEEAQSLKIQDDESVLHATLHAIANIIIKDLINNEENEFYKKLDTLKETVDETKKQIAFCLHEKQGKGIERHNEKLVETVMQLAMLGELNYISMAIRYKELNHLKLPDNAETSKLNYKSANYAAPLQLQREYGEKYYAFQYQKYTNIDYDRFVQLLIQSNVDKNLQKHEEEKKLEEQSTHSICESHEDEPITNNEINQQINTIEISDPETIKVTKPVSLTVATTNSAFSHFKSKRKDSPKQIEQDNSDVHSLNS